MRGLKEKFSESLPPLLAFFIFTIFFELLVRAGVISSTLIPAPTQVLETLIEMRTDFLKAGQETLQNALCGLIFSIFFGGGTALLFSLFEILKKAILAFAVFFQTVPIIAIAPLLVIYFVFGA
ncbi:MAG TPA: hypothetical protein VN132_12165, partial [Bdellovibrio sp.]|nr:hypothetical protein [Bdellovibrio sp.]